MGRDWRGVGFMTGSGQGEVDKISRLSWETEKHPSR